MTDLRQWLNVKPSVKSSSTSHSDVAPVESSKDDFDSNTEKRGPEEACDRFDYVLINPPIIDNESASNENNVEEMEEENGEGDASMTDLRDVDYSPLPEQILPTSVESSSSLCEDDIVSLFQHSPNGSEGGLDNTEDPPTMMLKSIPPIGDIFVDRNVRNEDEDEDRIITDEAIPFLDPHSPGKDPMMTDGQRTKRVRPFTAQEPDRKGTITSVSKRPYLDGRRKTVGGSPTVADRRPPTPRKVLTPTNQGPRRSPRLAEGLGHILLRDGRMIVKRQFDTMSINLGRVGHLFHSKFPSLTLTFTRKFIGDPRYEESRRKIKNWCHEIRNPATSCLRPAVDITYSEPPAATEDLLKVDLLVCHPDEGADPIHSHDALASGSKGPSIDIVCTLARGGVILRHDFPDYYLSNQTHYFPPPFERTQFKVVSSYNQNNARQLRKPSLLPLSTQSPILSPPPKLESPPPFSDTPEWLPIEHLRFPPIASRHPRLAKSQRRLLEGMTVALLGDFAPPNPPYGVLRSLLKSLGTAHVLAGSDYRKADLVMCSSSFHRAEGINMNDFELAKTEHETKFLLYWRLRNVDGGNNRPSSSSSNQNVIASSSTLMKQSHDGSPRISILTPPVGQRTSMSSSIVEEALKGDSGLRTGPLFRTPKSVLFKDYTPLRGSPVTPFRAQLSEELLNGNDLGFDGNTPGRTSTPRRLTESAESMSQPQNIAGQSVPNKENTTELGTSPLLDGGSHSGDSGYSLPLKAKTRQNLFLSSTRGKIFVKSSWLIQSVLLWQLQVPSIFLPMVFKALRRRQSANEECPIDSST